MASANRERTEALSKLQKQVLEQTKREEEEKTMSGLGYISVEPDRTCELCGKVDECRPYGPNKEQVCFSCGMKDEQAAIRAFSERVLGDKP